MFRWVTLELSTYPPASGAPWSIGNPDNAAGGEDCVAVLTNGGRLNDASCTSGNAAKPYLCECDGFAPTPQ